MLLVRQAASRGEDASMSMWNELLDRIASGNPPVPPHAETLRIPHIDGWEKGRVWSSWTVDDKLIQPHGSVFGGYLSAVADEMVGMATMTVLDDHEIFITSNCRMDYFRPAGAEKLRVEATVIHRGRSCVNVEAAFTNADGKLVAKAFTTQFLRRHPEK